MIYSDFKNKIFACLYFLRQFQFSIIILPLQFYYIILGAINLAFVFATLTIILDLITIRFINIRNSVYYSIFNTILFLAKLIVLLIFIKATSFDVFFVPTESMENSLKVGDLVLVNKVCINNTNLFNKVIEHGGTQNSNFINQLKNSGRINHNDIVIYRFAVHSYVTKRCIALSGDVMMIKNGDISVNGKRIEEQDSVINSYNITLTNSSRLWQIRHYLDLNNIAYTVQENKKLLWIEIDKVQLKNLARIFNINISKIKNDSTTRSNWKVIQGSKNSHWNVDNIGPIVVPFKGMGVNLNDRCSPAYTTAISRVAKEGLQVKINKKILDVDQGYVYYFNEDFYFLLGDNRDVAIDSRFLGFIPHREMIGKVILVLCNTKYFEWKRTFSFVR